MTSERKKEYMKMWREKNRAHVIEYQKRYNEENRERKAEYSREYYHSHREHTIKRMRKYKHENRERIDALHSKYLKKTGRAQPKLLAAIARGEIKKEPCEICGDVAQAHHDNYNYPLEVRWLCCKHHAEWHRFNKPIYYGEEK